MINFVLEKHVLAFDWEATRLESAVALRAFDSTAHARGSGACRPSLCVFVIGSLILVAANSVENVLAAHPAQCFFKHLL